MAKVGEGHVAAMARQGLDELRNAFYPESNVAQQQAEYGVYGTLTPGEVAEARRPDADARDLEEEKSADRGSILEDRMQQAEGREVQGRDDKDLDLER
jgi:hypothetical protein